MSNENKTILDLLKEQNPEFDEDTFFQESERKMNKAMEEIEKEYNHTAEIKVKKEKWKKFINVCEDYGLDAETVIRIYIYKFTKDPDVGLMYDSIIKGEY